MFRVLGKGFDGNLIIIEHKPESVSIRVYKLGRLSIILGSIFKPKIFARIVDRWPWLNEGYTSQLAMSEISLKKDGSIIKIYGDDLLLLKFIQSKSDSQKVELRKAESITKIFEMLIARED